MAFRPYVLPAPGLVLSTLIADWAVLSQSLAGNAARPRCRDFCWRLSAASGSRCCSTSRGCVEYSLYPYAVILQVTPVVAIAPLLLIYLPQQAAVLACAWIVAFFPGARQHHARAEFGRPQSRRPVPALRRLAHAGAVAAEAAGGAALYSRRVEIAGGLSLIGAVVAEIAAGSAGAGSGLAYRIAESGYRLNIPRMFAALVLLSVAGSRDLLRAVGRCRICCCAAGTKVRWRASGN